MKLSLVFLLLVVLTVPVMGQQYREVDLRVNGVGAGASHSTVVRKLGRPLRTKRERVSLGCTGSAETHLRLHYSGLEIELFGDDKGRNLVVYKISVVSKQWSASGVRIGARAQDVLARFGEPGSKGIVSGDTVYYYAMVGNLGGVNFYFRGDQLVRVMTGTTMC